MASTTFTRVATRLLGAALLGAALMGCQASDELGYGPKHLREVSRETRAEMVKLDVNTTAPVLMRIFKEENAFEVWRKDRSGRYVLVKTFEICKWSGKLGPKIQEGDRQAPEGYYTITPALMNPNSQYYLAFNTGFPNAYDRSNGRTGTALMVHGSCSSRGCYAMTDAQIQEIYAMARDAFRGGQRSFQLQAYPFRMTPENMAKHWKDPNMAFWKMLKVGYDHFELTRQEPKVDVCGRRYVFNSKPKDGVEVSPVMDCPVMEMPEELRLAAERKAADDERQAIVIAARLDGERKAAEDKAILLAAAEEERTRAAEERRLKMEERTRAVASLFGVGSPSAGAAPVQAQAQAQAEAATATAVAAASGAVPAIAGATAAVSGSATVADAGLPAAAPDGTPLPRRNPRLPATALALAPPPPATPVQQRSAGMFTRLFSFGEAAPADAAATTGTTAAAASAVTATPGGAAVVTAVPAGSATDAATTAATSGTAAATRTAAVADARTTANGGSSFWPFGRLF